MALVGAASIGEMVRVEFNRRDAGRLAVATGVGALAPTVLAPAASAAGGNVAPPGVVVKRYAVALKYEVCVRSKPSTATPGVVVATLPAGASVTGSYNSTGLWFHITSGTHAGRWMSAGVLVAAANIASFNGRLTSADLAPLPSWAINTSYSPGVTRYLTRTAAGAFLNMDAAFRATFGVHLTVTDAYRSYARQQSLYRSLGPSLAAVPGTSNHGFGNALDFGKAGTNASTSPYAYGRAYDVWLTKNGWKWGFDRPAYMDRTGSKPEWWHYNFTG